MQPHIIMYTSSFCPVCQMMRQLLEALQAPYEEIVIDTRPVERMKLIAKTKRLTVPQTNIDGIWISGFQPEHITKTIYDARMNRLIT